MTESNQVGLKTKLKARFERLDSKRKRMVVLAGVGSVAFAIIVLISSITPDTRGQTSNNSRSKEERRAGPNLLSMSSASMGLESVSQDVNAARGEMTEQRSEIDQLKAELEELKNRPPNESATELTPDQALASMRSTIEESPVYLNAPAGTTFNSSRPGVAPQAAQQQPQQSQGMQQNPGNRPMPGGQQQQALPEAPTMRVVRGKPTAVTAAPVAAPIPDVYIPTGSIMSGVLLNGLDAPTGRGASSQPIPVVIRLKHEAILPSRYRSDVREAFVLASGYGDLSSERAYLRAEQLSMILRNGRVVDIPIKMSAIGDDGKTGIRGNVVSKQGALIAKALMAGTADGVSRAFGGNSNFSSGRSELPESRDLIVGGLGGGASSALDRVASYFLQQAEAMYPVVEIAGGREVSFILLEGTDLSPRPLPEAPLLETDEIAVR